RWSAPDSNGTRSQYPKECTLSSRLYPVVDHLLVDERTTVGRKVAAVEVVQFRVNCLQVSRPHGRRGIDPESCHTNVDETIQKLNLLFADIVGRLFEIS